MTNIIDEFLGKYPKELPISSKPEIPKNKRVEALNKERGVEFEEEDKEEKKKKNKGIKINKLLNIIKISPKKNLFKRERATIVLPNKPAKPILRRSEIFNNEYEKEKKLLGWK